MKRRWNKSATPALQRAAPRNNRPAAEPSTGRSAFFVGAGILISRIVGLIRQRIFAHYFGSSAEGDAFSAAFRIPNFLQNVFGEGALSASFIPVYAKLLAQERRKRSSPRRQCDLLDPRAGNCRHRPNRRTRHSLHRHADRRRF